MQSYDSRPTQLMTPLNDARITVVRVQSYLFYTPLLLPKYLQQFAINDKFLSASIVDGPHASICKGVGGRTHKFLSLEGHKICEHSGELICMHCCNMTDQRKCYCLSCYATNSAIWLSGCDGSKRTSVMHCGLKDDSNFDHVDTLPSDKIEEAYNCTRVGKVRFSFQFMPQWTGCMHSIVKNYWYWASIWWCILVQPCHTISACSWNYQSVWMYGHLW